MSDTQTLSKKIDFAVIFSVKHANPNGNPLDGNRPRITDQGYGEVSDVCIKRKMRDRLQDSGETIFVQSDDRRKDNYESLKVRANGEIGDVLKAGKSDDIRDAACAKWIDVRAFGQVFAFKPEKDKKSKGKKAVGEESEDASDSSNAKGVSIPIRGPVTVFPAFSTERLTVSSIQITKSVSSEKSGESRSSDTMGMKHRIDSGIYWFAGSISPQLAERTGFTDADAAKIKAVLPKLFENDASSARPDGSMRVLKVYWWEQPKGNTYSSAKVHGSLTVAADGTSTITPLDGLKPEEVLGF